MTLLAFKSAVIEEAFHLEAINFTRIVKN